MLDQMFPQMTCRKCESKNPIVYFAPVIVPSLMARDNTPQYPATCICLSCAKSRGWLDGDDNLKSGVQL